MYPPAMFTVAPELEALNVHAPALFTVARAVVFVAMPTVFAAGRYTPLAGTVLLDGIRAVAVTLLLNVPLTAVSAPTPVRFWLFHGVADVGTPVPSRRMQLERPAAMSDSWPSSFDISIGDEACSVTQL